MIAVISGDVIASRTLKDQSVWMNPIKSLFKEWGQSPKDWEILSGDTFQVEVPQPEEAMIRVLHIKSLVRSIAPIKGKDKFSDIDVRMSIGIGEKQFSGESVSESNGPAFVFSGEKLEMLKKEKNTLSICSEDEDFNQRMNLYLRFAQHIMNNWTTSSAEMMLTVLKHPDMKQSDIGKLLGIKQPSVSTRLHRARVDDLLEMDRVYRKQVQALNLS